MNNKRTKIFLTFDPSTDSKSDLNMEDPIENKFQTRAEVHEVLYTNHTGYLDSRSIRFVDTWRATITIVVNYSIHMPVANVTVSGYWSGGRTLSIGL